MNKKILEELQFKFVETPWSKKFKWIYTGDNTNPSNHVIDYNMETKNAKALLGEFSVISRVCNTKSELEKFIESIDFLQNKPV